MHLPQRNQLVWLTGSAWQAILQRAWDEQALDILGYWQARQLPLVVCRQRTAESGAHVCLGLPAPNQWGRRKLTLDAALTDLARVGAFPLLADLAFPAADAAALVQLQQHMDALGVALQVYGSYGWQHLSGLPCVREASDLDLLAPVADLAVAAQVVWLLQGLSLHCRVDGELLFPNGWAVAWREYAQLISGKVEQVLVKERAGVHLLEMPALRRALRPPRQESASCSLA